MWDVGMGSRGFSRARCLFHGVEAASEGHPVPAAGPANDERDACLSELAELVVLHLRQSIDPHHGASRNSIQGPPTAGGHRRRGLSDRTAARGHRRELDQRPMRNQPLTWTTARYSGAGRPEELPCCRPQDGDERDREGIRELYEGEEGYWDTVHQPARTFGEYGWEEERC